MQFLFRFADWLDTRVFYHHVHWLCNWVWDWQLEHGYGREFLQELADKAIAEYESGELTPCDR